MTQTQPTEITVDCRECGQPVAVLTVRPDKQTSALCVSCRAAAWGDFGIAFGVPQPTTPSAPEEVEYTHMLQVEAGGKWADTDSFDEWEDAHAVLTRCQRVGLNARVELRLKTAAASVALFLALTSQSAHAQDLTACHPAGSTGEGFPVIHCPLTGETLYQDIDGTDGSRGTEGDGRWIQLP